jgi:hypothetical protein
LIRRLLAAHRFHASPRLTAHGLVPLEYEWRNLASFVLAN